MFPTSFASLLLVGLSHVTDANTGEALENSGERTFSTGGQRSFDTQSIQSPGPPVQSPRSSGAGAEPTQERALDSNPAEEGGERQENSDVVGEADEAESEGPRIESSIEDEEKEKPEEASQGEEKSAEQKEVIKHRGFTIDFRLGTGTCTRDFCRRKSALNAGPSFGLDGFFGGNIAGFVDLGLIGGWSRSKARLQGDADAWSIFGIDNAAAMRAAEDWSDFGAASMAVDEGNIQTGYGGLGVRIHFIPRGPFAAYAGLGMVYSTFVGDFSGVGSEDVRLNFFGIGVPFHGGFAYYFHKRFALVTQFDYRWVRYLAVSVRSDSTFLVVPIDPLEDVLSEYDISLKDKLPHVWRWTIGIRMSLSRRN